MKSIQTSLYHSSLRIALVVFAMVLVFDSGLFLPVDPDGRAHEAVELMEQGFPERVGDAAPLVTFQPKGRGGLVMRFEGLAAGEAA